MDSCGKGDLIFIGCNIAKNIISKSKGIYFEKVDATTGRKASYFTEAPVQVVLKDDQVLKKLWQ